MTTATFGTLTDYKTGEQIRPAGAEEWRYTANLVNGSLPGSYTGAWDEGGRTVYVDGGPQAEVTDADIADLEQEAAQHGDERQAALCRLALGGTDEPESVIESARVECVRIVLGNRLNCAGE